MGIRLLPAVRDGWMTLAWASDASGVVPFGVVAGLNGVGDEDADAGGGEGRGALVETVLAKGRGRAMVEMLGERLGMREMRRRSSGVGEGSAEDAIGEWCEGRMYGRWRLKETTDKGQKQDYNEGKPKRRKGKMVNPGDALSASSHAYLV